MRNPSTRSKSDDLSCLTSSSTSSREQNSIKYPILVDSENNSKQFNSAYLPQLIDPNEWHHQNVSRKRKERQDSTSSITQDRKLVRSNSEEFLPTIGYEVIRRVSSHDEIKISINENENENILQPLIAQDQQYLGNHHTVAHRSYHHDGDMFGKSANNEVQEILREAYRRSETSPARSRTFDFSHKLRISPSHDAAHHGEVIDEFCDRRSSERFCKARVVSRKSTNKKSCMPLVKQSSSTDNEYNDTAAYKYDISAMKSERRGFISKRQPDQGSSNSDTTLAGNVSSEEYLDEISSSFSDHNENNDYTDSVAGATINKRRESLPWDNSNADDDVPVRSQRFSDDKYDHAYNAMTMRNESFGAELPHFAKGDDIKSRDLLKMNQLPSVFTASDGKLKQINKRLAALKKRVIAFEESFELEHGYRPPHSIKMNDRYTKNALAEIHKLRKEKQIIKADPANAIGFKTILSGDENNVQKMRDTIAEIEKRLQAKRIDEKRSSVLEEMTANELVQEKTAVQRALLYLESLYGRPNTREERDAARLLYNRYRIIKRLVNRSVSLSGSGMNNPSELPTILEHEAMAFTVAAVSLTPPPSDSEALNNIPSAIDSSTDSTALISSTDSTDTSSSINENVHEMSLDELKHSVEIIREEKRKLRRTIKDFEEVFEEQNGRKMLKSDRNVIQDTYTLYKQKKAKLRLLDALMRKQLTKI